MPSNEILFPSTIPGKLTSPEPSRRSTPVSMERPFGWTSSVISIVPTSRSRVVWASSSTCTAYHVPRIETPSIVTSRNPAPPPCCVSATGEATGGGGGGTRSPISWVWEQPATSRASEIVVRRRIRMRGREFVLQYSRLFTSANEARWSFAAECCSRAGIHEYGAEVGVSQRNGKRTRNVRRDRVWREMQP